MSVELDDDAFVQKIRERLGTAQRFRWFLIGSHAIAVVAYPILFFLWCRVAMNAQWPGMGMGFGLGVVVGTTLGFAFITALRTLFQHLFDRGRDVQLLVKYYDEAHELRKQLGKTVRD